jgi:hypothetical protein
VRALVRYVALDYIRSGLPLIELACAGAYIYVVFVGLDYSIIEVTRFAAFSAPFLTFLGALSATLLCRRGATARGLTVLAKLPRRSPFLLARLVVAWSLALGTFTFAMLVILAFGYRVQGDWPALAAAIGLLLVGLTFGVGGAALFSPLTTPHSFRLGLLAYVALLGTALVWPAGAIHDLISPALYPALPAIGAAELAAQLRAEPLLLAATAITIGLEAAFVLLACRLFARRELLFE